MAKPRSESLDLKTTSTKQAPTRNDATAARATEDYDAATCLRQASLYLRHVTPIRKPTPSASATVASGGCVMASSSDSSIEDAASWAASIIALPRSDMSSTACSAPARACL